MAKIKTDLSSSLRSFSPIFSLIPINILTLLSLDLGTPLKILLILIKHSLGGIYPNDFWVMEISCVLAPPQNFGARSHPMLPKNQHSLLVRNVL